jgi:hypothetical protein
MNGGVNTMNLRSLLAVAVLGSLALGCEGNGRLIINALVDRWCGDRPCDWEVKGKIKRAGSWHDDDYAVSFVSDHATLSQFNANADAANADCYDFTMIAKLDRKTRLFLELDFFDDGKIDFSERIPESDWDRRSFLVTTPTWYQGVRFIVRKDGPGFAALAQLSAKSSQACTAPPIDLGPRPERASCERGDQCASGVCEVVPACVPTEECSGVLFCFTCAPMACKGCLDDAGCPKGQVCAPSGASGSSMHSCTYPSGGDFGARCDADNQCQSALCCGSACSECCDDSTCANGQSCGLPSDWQNSYTSLDLHWPQLCAPGAGVRARGELCANDEDCASGRCANDAHRCDPDPCLGRPNCGALCFTPRVIGGTCE